MKPRPLALAAVLSVPFVACYPAAAQQAVTTQVTAPTEPYKWEVGYPASTAVVGIEKNDLLAYFKEQHGEAWKKGLDKRDEEKRKDAEKRGVKINSKTNEWDQIWNVLLIWTPAMKEVRVPAFRISQFEVTNAQWEVFLRHRTEHFKTTGAESLEDLAMKFWSIAPTRNNAALDINRGWRSIVALNKAVLDPVLNPKKDPKYDILMARGQEAKLPADLELSYYRYIPPTHWTNGEVPKEERRRPMRAVSWEQSMDFCWWAGFHLPTEAEWERAARGEKGRLFPWGDTWNPTNAVWGGYNAAAKVAYNAAIKAKAKPEVCPIVAPGVPFEDAPSETPSPADVDSMPAGATPEDVRHMVGNVAEMTLDFITKYSWNGNDSEAQFGFYGQAVLAKGQHYQEHRPELVNAVNRNWESAGGAANRPDHILDGMGFRLASYPTAGADLAVAAIPFWTDQIAQPDRPYSWIPNPPGFGEREKARPFLGFDPANAGGYLERTLNPKAEDFAFITGASAGLVFLPVKGFPTEFVKSPSDLNKLASDPARPLFLGLLIGTEGTRIELNVEGGKKTTLSMGDERLWLKGQGRVYTKAPLGAMLVYSQGRVLVYAPTESMSPITSAKNRGEPIGYIDPGSVKIEMAKDAAPSSTVGAETSLTSVIPMLDPKARPMKDAKKFLITLKFPLVATGK